MLNWADKDNDDEEEKEDEGDEEEEERELTKFLAADKELIEI